MNVMSTKEELIMRAQVSRGAEKGNWLYPHEYRDGMFVVSKTRFECDYIRVASEQEAKEMVKKGYRLRMSNKESPSLKTPSLIRPEPNEFIGE
jgi:hypothetical protein